MSDPNGKESYRVNQVTWRVLILVVFMMLTFPPCFGSMGTGLDASWLVGLNEASDRQMVYGRDIVFTYGPLGFALAPLDLGSNIQHAILFRLGLNILWWTSVGSLLFRIHGYTASLLFAVASVLSGIHFGPTCDFNLGLTGVLILTTAGYLLLAHVDRRLIWAVPAVIVSAAALLAKFNIGVATAGSVGAWAIIQLLRDRSQRVLLRLGLLALTYAVTLGLLFRVYGGPINALGDFLRYSSMLAAGFSSQMSGPGPASELAALSTLLILAVIACAVGIPLKSPQTPALSIMLFPLFVLFKAAIVRHDAGHFLTSCPPIIGLTAFLLPGARGRLHRLTTQGIVSLALLGGLWFAPSKATNVLARGASSWASLCKLKETRSSIQAIEANVKNQLKLPASIRSRIGSETVDVYPWDISLVTANGLNWRPRFVFQSYAAYNPELDFKCAANYRSENAPKFIVYSHKAIDGQHPCIVDSRTWIEIYHWYDVVEQDGDQLLLQRRVSPRWGRVDKQGSKSVAFRERCKVPEDGQGAVILQAKLKLTLLGRMICAIYKVYPPTVRVEYKDGTVADHRLSWQDAGAGFLVSSLPRDPTGVRKLLETGEADQVQAVSFDDQYGAFEGKIRVTWLRTSPSPASPMREPTQPVASIESKPMTR